MLKPSNELDNYYPRLYGLTRDELRDILDPKEVYWKNLLGETFRVLKKKKINAVWRARDTMSRFGGVGSVMRAAKIGGE